MTRNISGNWRGRPRRRLRLAMCLLGTFAAWGAGRAPGQVVINEIMYHPDSALDAEEYLELFNAGATPVNLLDWEIDGGVEFVFPSYTLLPGAHLVVAADLAAFSAKYPAVTNVIGGWTGRLSNRGERVRLRDADNRTVNEVEYADEGEWAVREEGQLDIGHRGWTWSEDHDGLGKSLELINPAKPNEHGQNWGASLIDQGTPGTANTLFSTDTAPLILDVVSSPILPSSASDVTVTARILDPEQATTAGLTVELHYRVDTSTYQDIVPPNRPTYDPASYTVIPMNDDGASTDALAGDGVFSASIPAQPHGTVVEYFILARDGAGARTLPAPALVLGAPRQVVNRLYQVDDNAAQQVVLPRGSVWRYLDDGTDRGTTWSAVAYDDSSWSVGPAEFGFNDADEATLINFGGNASNKHMTYYFRATFEIADTSQITGLTIRLLRDDGAVVYLNGGEAFRSNMPLGPVVYSTPALSNPGQPEERTFFDYAVDPARLVNGANVVAVELHLLSPSEGDMSFNLEVAVSEPGNPAAGWSPGDQPLYYFVMTEAERAELADIGNGGGGEQNSDAQMNVTFISIDEEGAKVRYNVGVRNRGHGSRGNPPNNHRLNFRHDRTWNGMTALNINSKFTHFQTVGNLLFTESALDESPEVWPVHLRVNGQDLSQTAPANEMYGSYLALEVVNSDWAENHFPDDSNGNVYKGMRIVAPGANLRYLNPPHPDPYRVDYFKQTNEELDDWQDLVDLTWALDASPDDQYLAAAEAAVNTEQWMRFIAMNVLLDNAETTLANGNGDDYYMYRGIVDPRFVLIQHDLDSILGRGGSVWNNGIFDAAVPGWPLERLMLNPQYTGRYYTHLDDLINTTFAPGFINPFLDETLGGWVPQPTIDVMKAFVVQRRRHVRSLIPNTFTVNAPLPVSNGYYHSTTDTVPLFGTAPGAWTQSIRVNDQPAPWTWTPFDGTWQLGDGAPGQTDTLLSAGSVWRYRDDVSSDPGMAWIDPAFNDDAWSSGPAQLGYGDGDEATVVGFGGDATNKHITTLFRHTFTVDDASQYNSLTLRLLRDDGIVVYFNGDPIPAQTDNMPAVFDWLTTSLTSVNGADESTFFVFPISASYIQDGDNTIAVEIHQLSHNTSSDISFDLELLGIVAGDPMSGGVPLAPGVNRLTVETYDGPGGSGNRLRGATIDVWYDDGSPWTIVPGITLIGDTTFTAPGPYHIIGDIIVPVGVTLTIEPGTQFFINAGVGIIVYGRLVAEGEPYNLIRLTHNPLAGGAWNGIRFEDTQEDNRLAHVAMDFADGRADAILVDHSRLLIDGLTWTDTSKKVLEIADANLIVRNSTFPTINNNEAVHGYDIPAGGYLIFQGNTFNRNSGYNDLIDFTNCKRPNPIIQILDNLFLGGGDDGLDLDAADAHIEGNIFMNFNQDAPRASSSNAIATGRSGGLSADVTLARNIFIGNDHDLLLKEGSSGWIANNTFIDAVIGSINFDEAGNPGQGALLEGNIFRNVAAALLNQAATPTPTIVANQNNFAPAFHGLGFGNLDADPLFADADIEDYHLLDGPPGPRSPCIDTGPNFLDMGAWVPAGASISGEPPAFTDQTNATLIIAGPGIVTYRYSLDGGPYSAEALTAQPLELTGLADGDHQVHVIGKNSAAVWQDIAQATPSRVWTVNTRLATLLVTELMYDPPAGNDFEFLELHNPSTTSSFNLSGLTFTAGVTYTFPLGAGIPPDGYVLLTHASDAAERAAFRAHYGLDPAVNILGPIAAGRFANEGERVTLEDGSANVVFTFEYSDARGWPLPADGAGHSLVPLEGIAPTTRSLDYGRNWRFSSYSGGSPGAADPQLPPTVVLNEVMAHTDYAIAPYDSNDWIELYNHGPAAVNLAGWYLSDDEADLRKWAIPPTATIPAGGRLSFDEVTGFHNPITSGFGLDKGGERVFLSHLPGTSEDRVVDFARFKGQENGVSLSRTPDGGEFWRAASPTRDAPNAPPNADAVIGEFMFNPLVSQDYEYLEIHNPTAAPLDLFNVVGPYRLDGAIAFTFPPNISIPASGVLLVVKFDPADGAARAAFETIYGALPPGAPLVGPFIGNLDNGGERLALERPQAPDPPETLGSWVIVDEVIYFDENPWTDRADGTGLSLHRLSDAGAGNDPDNWVAGLPSPGGAGEGAIVAPTVQNLPATNITGISATLHGAIVATGGANPLTRIYWGTTDGRMLGINWEHSAELGVRGAGAFSLDVSGLQPETLYYYRVYARNAGGYAWAGAAEVFITTVDSTTYALTVAAVNGAVARQPDRPLFLDGETVTLTATPAGGYLFTGWGGDVPPANVQDNPLTLTMDRDRNVIARFAPEPFPLAARNYWMLY